MAASGADAVSQRQMTVAPTGRYLLDASGKPFFWLGDTAWMLFQATTRGEAELYLRARARRGFSVIQAALVMSEERVAGTLLPNAYGELAFVDGDPARPNLTPRSDPAGTDGYGYWDHVDFIVDSARAMGLTLALLPMFVGSRGDGYKYLTTERAGAYGAFLGRRYRALDNVVWVLGGDHVPVQEEHREVWQRVAEGITEGVAGAEDFDRTLMAYHIAGGNSSSAWFHGAAWLDVNMIQTWSTYDKIFPMVTADYRLTPPKPVVLAEAAYEDGPQYPTKPINAHVIRKQAYWSYFAGGFHTYGNTNVWNFGTYKPEATQDWQSGLDSPGAASLTILRRFFEDLEWWNLLPDQSIFAAESGNGGTLNVAMRSGNGAVAYLPDPATVVLAMDRIGAAGEIRAAWVDPRSGERGAAGIHPRAGARSFSTPEGWEDALLVLVADRRRASEEEAGG